MSQMKMTAYRTEFESDRVYAAEHQAERDAHNGGEPFGDFIAWSLDPPGERKRLRHVRGRNGGPPHFAYQDASAKDASGGESLDHLLFKEALGEVQHTHLALNGGDRFAIRITHAELEKRVEHPSGRYYYIDVYLRFESTHVFAEKWSGEIYFEVCHKNPVHKEKRDDLRSLGLPVIEFKLSELFQYRYDQTNTSRAREEYRKAMTKKILEGDTGFAPARILSNPSSIPYLTRELGERTRELESAKKTLSEQGHVLSNLRAQEHQLRLKNQTVESSLREQADGITKLRASVRNLTEERNAASSRYETLKRRAIISTASAFVALAIAVMTVWWLWPSVPTIATQAPVAMSTSPSSGSESASIGVAPSAPPAKPSTRKHHR
jgi:hypothetical protein